MTRYKVSVQIQLSEFTIGTDHHHKATFRVLEFGDSKTDAFREFNRLEKAILELLAFEKEKE